MKSFPTRARESNKVASRDARSGLVILIVIAAAVFAICQFTGGGDQGDKPEGYEGIIQGCMDRLRELSAETAQPSGSESQMRAACERSYPRSQYGSD